MKTSGSESEEEGGGGSGPQSSPAAVPAEPSGSTTPDGSGSQ